MIEKLSGGLDLENKERLHLRSLKSASESEDLTERECRDVNPQSATEWRTGGAARTVLGSQCMYGGSRSPKLTAETKATRCKRVIDRARMDESWL